MSYHKRNKAKRVALVTGALLFLYFATAVGLSLIDRQAVGDPQVQPAAIEAGPVPQVNLQELWQHTNEQRTAHGLTPLVLHPSLNESAQAKCDDMVARNYWSHNDPGGSEPWGFIKVPYSNAGENLAYGFFNANNVVAGWMNSPSHKENLLTSFYTNVGFGICESENYVDTGHQVIVVQHFIN